MLTNGKFDPIRAFSHLNSTFIQLIWKEISGHLFDPPSRWEEKREPEAAAPSSPSSVFSFLPAVLLAGPVSLLPFFSGS
ncbi:hypothetical protein [Acutalibacter sp. 1XD8-33]|uniref:hypothetical protein n=1 Tax=Acutalibacter sp. 1XD8-33 TaxID=2320081 RepID=UPI0011C3D0E3|nr:hypothetical protein [Acutalibacter sp. 1XD8-33]